jgi:hypothetical protein
MKLCRKKWILFYWHGSENKGQVTDHFYTNAATFLAIFQEIAKIMLFQKNKNKLLLKLEKCGQVGTKL